MYKGEPPGRDGISRGVSLARSVKGALFAGVAGVEHVLRPGQLRGTGSLSAVRNFLLLQYPAALGTAVHATPLVPALHEAVPGSRVAVAASGLAVEVFRNNPGVEDLLITPSPLRDLRGATRALRAQLPFDGEPFATLTTRGNERTLIALAALAAGAANRLGFTEAPELFRPALTFDPMLSLIDNNLRIVEALGHAVQHFEPEIFITHADVTAARRALIGSGVRDERPLAIFVTQNSGGQQTGWHLDRFVEVIRHASEELGCAVVYVGTARDADAIAEIQQATGGLGVSIVGKTSVTELAAALAMSDVMVTLDTGTMHVGRAAKVPMVVLGPSWQKPLEWLPLEVANVRILRGQDRDTVPENYHLDEISAAAVIAALEELLQSYPPLAAARERRVEQSLSAD